MSSSVLEALGAEKCIPCAACIGTGVTLLRDPCPRCDGRGWLDHGWACRNQHPHYNRENGSRDE